jgi:hypothetical protein
VKSDQNVPCNKQYQSRIRDNTRDTLGLQFDTVRVLEGRNLREAGSLLTRDPHQALDLPPNKRGRNREICELLA